MIPFYLHIVLEFSYGFLLVKSRLDFSEENSCIVSRYIVYIEIWLENSDRSSLGSAIKRFQNLAGKI